MYSSSFVAGASVVSLLLIACGEAPARDPADGADVDTVYARRTIVDSTYVGMARFRGQIELSGRTIPYFDSDLRHESVCFEADSASAARVPRWLHDERRSWFCFSNPHDAARALAPPGTEVDATIIVDELVIHRGLSDEVNSSRFVERVGPDRPGH